MKNKIGNLIIGMLAVIIPIGIVFGLIFVVMRPILGYWPFIQNDPRIAQQQIEFTKYQAEHQHFQENCDLLDGVLYGYLCLAKSSLIRIYTPLTD